MSSPPIVFTDFHHPSLLYSLILLFEKKMGGMVFRPIGKDWYTQGFWKIYLYHDAVDQFLEIGNTKHNSVVSHLCNDSTFNLPVYVCKDYTGFSNNAITLESFYKIPFDILIATIPEHIVTFRKLCEAHPNKPKLVYQIGNPWSIEAGISNVMASAKIQNVPKNINFISYHQEFDLSIFHPDFSYPAKNICSFVNCFNTADIYTDDWKLFESVESIMSDWNLKSYGALCRDGEIVGQNKLADRMRDSRFIWHTKFGGDGYGHIIYNSAAVARPLVVKMEYYDDRLGKELMQEGKTCLAIDGLTPQEIVNKILYYSEENRYAALCKNVNKNFKEKVDFDKENIALHSFIKRLK
ncbi:hypothetical protein [Peribacillus simplex]|uniref:hypothetical protein n=1 Tax=Peribacillus simplex TaxID=1478 RepID=UPI00366CE31C